MALIAYLAGPYFLSKLEIYSFKLRELALNWYLLILYEPRTLHLRDFQKLCTLFTLPLYQLGMWDIATSSIYCY